MDAGIQEGFDDDLNDVDAPLINQLQQNNQAFSIAAEQENIENMAIVESAALEHARLFFMEISGLADLGGAAGRTNRQEFATDPTETEDAIAEVDSDAQGQQDAQSVLSSNGIIDTEFTEGCWVCSDDSPDIELLKKDGKLVRDVKVCGISHMAAITSRSYPPSLTPFPLFEPELISTDVTARMIFAICAQRNGRLVIAQNPIPCIARKFL
ncbi:hypothetical protein EG329_004821 [Mollisiaceae sp. DMI_Dod_QoI]|nr:hypothetical protein EG329_004821 [Helotiales sp. DMI_Dod_QoI]